MYLQGPITFSRHRNKDKEIIIFGDYHRRNENEKCAKNSINVFQLLVKLKKTKHLIDLHLESIFQTTDYIKPEYIKINGFLVGLEEALRNHGFLSRIKKKSNFRFHYDDIRDLRNNHEFWRFWNSELHIFLEKTKKTPDKLLTLFSHKYYLLLMNKFLKTRFNAQRLFYETRITKQIQALNSEYKPKFLQLQKDLAQGLREENIHVKTLVKLLLRLIKNKDTSSLNEIFSKQFHEYHQTKQVGVELQDIYMLSRIFKDTTRKNVIIYVGDNHAENMRKILENFGFELVSDTGSRPFIKNGQVIADQCLLLDDLRVETWFN